MGIFTPIHFAFLLPKMLLNVRMQHAVAINYSLNRHMEYVQQIIGTSVSDRKKQNRKAAVKTDI